jgi:hypothetical protein
VSVGSEGAIFIWKMPAEVTHARADNELPTVSKEKYTNNKNAQNNIDTKSQGSAASKGSQKKN